jgi:hypothetical protein
VGILTYDGSKFPKFEAFWKARNSFCIPPSPKIGRLRAVDPYENYILDIFIMYHNTE